MENSRGQWSSKLGFILAASGSAIGLGNIWRFPYIVGENGGAAFVVLYLFFVILLGIPYMLAELALGRRMRLNPVGSINAIKPNSPWKFVGLLGVITGIGILSFYGVIAGWTLGYIYNMAIASQVDFATFIANDAIVVSLFGFFMLLTALIVYGGVANGIEKWSKILMPVLFVLLVALIIYSNSLDGSSEGLKFYLLPDFNKINGSVVLSALGQAFFSLSLGMGMMLTYGSYLSRTDNLLTSAIWVAMLDTAIAFMAGLIIFPALFAMNQDPSSGAALVFVVFPKLFMSMPAGYLVGTIFFTLLSVAALTSTISLLEVPVAYLVDEKKVNRKHVVWWVAFVAFLVGIPSALSQGGNKFLTDFGLLPDYLSSKDFLSHVSFIFGDISLAFGALMMSIFVGWVWKAENASNEILIGCPQFEKISSIWQIFIKFIIPIVIFSILLNVFKIF